jgi:hypothetical protein
LGKGKAGARGFMGERKDHDSIQMGGTKWWWGLFSDSLDSSTRFLVYNYENTPSF